MAHKSDSFNCGFLIMRIVLLEFNIQQSFVTKLSYLNSTSKSLLDKMLFNGNVSALFSKFCKTI